MNELKRSVENLEGFFLLRLKAEEQPLYKALSSIAACSQRFDGVEGKYIWKKNSAEELGLLQRVEEGGFLASWWSGGSDWDDLQGIEKVLAVANRRFGSEALKEKRMQLEKRFETLQSLKGQAFEREAEELECDLDELISYSELFYSPHFSRRVDSQTPSSRIDNSLKDLNSARWKDGASGLNEQFLVSSKELSRSIYRNRSPLLDLREALLKLRESRDYLKGLCKGADLLKQSGIVLEEPVRSALLSLAEKEESLASLESIEKSFVEFLKGVQRDLEVEKDLEGQQELMVKLSEQVLFLKLFLSEVTVQNSLSGLLLQAEALLNLLGSLPLFSDRSLSYKRELLLERMDKELALLSDSNLKRRLGNRLEEERKESLKALLEPHFSKAFNKELILKKAALSLKKIEEASKKLLESDEKVLKLAHDEKGYACMLFKDESGKRIKSAYILFKQHYGLNALGKGSFSSSITLAYDVQARKMRVMKSVGPKIKEWKQYCDLFKEHEIEGFKAAQGVKGLIQLFDWAEYSSHKEADTKIAYFIELFKGGTCESLLKKKNSLTRDQKRALTGELLQALSNLQKRGLALRDIKPDNILMKKEKGKAKLADLGFIYSRDGKGEQGIMGTPHYLPPEYFVSWGRVSSCYETFQKHDSWSLGAVLYQLWFDKDPIWFKTKNLKMLTDCFTDSKFAAMQEPKEESSIEYIIYKLLQKNPANRWSGEEALKHFQALEKIC